jgi:hypothetical protein
MANRIGERLWSRGHATPSQVLYGLEYQRENGGRLGEIMMKLGFISYKDLIEIVNDLDI